ncbi:MAG: helix-turn-helix domain-containing protein, partial [Microterricola sp.]
DVASLVAEDTYARQTWALAAQRSLTNAALQPDGLNATLAELSRQLDHWVALYNSAGEFDRCFPADAAALASHETVGLEARRLLGRNRRASARVRVGGDNLSLQTLGRGDRLRGVLIVGSGDTALDRASSGLVDSVIALAGLALEQGRDLERARANLRSGVLHALLGGGFDLASAISTEMWGGLPGGPIRVAATAVTTSQRASLTDFLEVRCAAGPDAMFYAEQGDVFVICLGRSGEGLAAEIAERFALSVGISDAADWNYLPTAVTQAQQARERAEESEASIVEFDTLAREGVLAFLARTDAASVAGAMLAPLDAHDAANGTELRRTLQLWLTHDGRFDPAADELGVHRHTVRNRIALIEQLLGRDLRSFAVRADLWVALLATEGVSTRPR